MSKDDVRITIRLNQAEQEDMEDLKKWVGESEASKILKMSMRHLRWWLQKVTEQDLPPNLELRLHTKRKYQQIDRKIW